MIWTLCGEEMDRLESILIRRVLTARNRVKASMSSPPWYLFVAALKAAKPSPPSERNELATTR